MNRLPLALVVACLVGCGEAPPPDVIDREAFVATWVDLRTAAAQAGATAPPASERERILREHGVSEDELLGFVDTFGNEPRFMVEVWADVEARLRPPPATDSAAPPAG
jgi:hypothetical protein